jgi:beta-glucosidase
MRSSTRRAFLTSTGALGLSSFLPRSLDTLAMPESKTRGCPPGFFWGASTAAAQIEGSPNADGGGDNVWDVYLRTPNATKDGSTNLLADDDYHRWPEDLKLMQQLGFNAYRFSASWARILPEGKGPVNSTGLDYYDRLVDALLKAKITPFLTVYHFDYPEALQQHGGWLHPDSPQWLADYTHILSARLSDRVSHWLTINEPNILWRFGFEIVMPPKQKLEDADLVRGAHDILLGHGTSVQAIRAVAKQKVEVSLAFAGIMSTPATEQADDVSAAKAATFSVKRAPILPDYGPMAMLSASWWLDPIYLGKYPEDGLRMFPAAEKLNRSEDLRTINQVLDFWGVESLLRAQSQGKLTRRIAGCSRSTRDSTFSVWLGTHP